MNDKGQTGNKEGVDFVSATIHGLKTSLTAIIASAELLDDELQLDNKSLQGRLIQGIIRSAHGIDEKLSSLSQMTTPRTIDFRLQLEPVEIGRTIRNVVTHLYPKIQRERQSLTLELPDSLPPVRADRQYLEQVLATLIANAIKFTGEEGKLKVRAWQNNDSLVVQVSDTGIGIPVDEQVKIFQPYHQVSRNQGGKLNGSGLGLAIAKLFIELHGGKIWVESIVGQGSSFSFSLPLTE